MPAVERPAIVGGEKQLQLEITHNGGSYGCKQDTGHFNGGGPQKPNKRDRSTVRRLIIRIYL